MTVGDEGARGPVGDGPFVSFAQHGEDVVLWRALGGRERVTYVDVGAFHPRDDSVTHALYERGWRGVNLEAQPDRLQAFLDARPEDVNVGVAIGDVDGVATLTVPDNPGWASLVDAGVTGVDPTGSRLVEVQVRRLDTLLPELGVDHVDVLKIDVEGAEPGVVRGLGDTIRPTVCVVEGEAPGLGRTAGDAAVALLVDAGYTHCMFDGLNHYLTTDPSLVDALSVPANPLDHFRLDLVDRLMREREALLTTISVLAADAASLRAALAPTTDGASPDVDAVADEAPADVAPGTDGTVEQEAAATGPEPQDAGTHVEAADDDPQGEDPQDDDPLGDGAQAHDATTPDVPVATVFAAPDVRAARRRSTFRALVSGREPMPTEDAAPADPVVAPWDLERLAPAPLVAALYERVLGRAADDEGLAVWSAQIEAGHAAVDVAIALARSDEAQSMRPAARVATERFLRAWVSHRALAELGVVAPADRRYPDGQVAHAVFVDALYEVTFRRRPTKDEAAHEIHKLTNGIGRDWMIRSFAARPEAVSLLAGRGDGGVRGRLRAARAQRDQVATFRDLVLESESRILSQLMAAVTAVNGGPVPPGPRGA